MKIITVRLRATFWTAERFTTQPSIRSRQGIYYIYAGVYRLAGRNNLFAIHLLAIFVVTATALVVRRIGARVADEWAGAWSGIGYAVFVHAYLPATRSPPTPKFSRLFFYR
jgi:4-amino-4-deoxy-L-arabinose transferase-like glycosyltransferase